jgi:hypothetical protein
MDVTWQNILGLLKNIRTHHGAFDDVAKEYTNNIS